MSQKIWIWVFCLLKVSIAYENLFVTETLGLLQTYAEVNPQVLNIDSKVIGAYRTFMKAGKLIKPLSALKNVNYNTLDFYTNFALAKGTLHQFTIGKNAAVFILPNASLEVELMTSIQAENVSIHSAVFSLVSENEYDSNVTVLSRLVEYYKTHELSSLVMTNVIFDKTETGVVVKDSCIWSRRRQLNNANLKAITS